MTICVQHSIGESLCLLALMTSLNNKKTQSNRSNPESTKTNIVNFETYTITKILIPQRRVSLKKLYEGSLGLSASLLPVGVSFSTHPSDEC